MKSIARFLLSGAFAATLLAPVAFAAATDEMPPPPPPHEGRPERGPGRMDAAAQLKMMTEQLGLTTDQQAQLLPILEARDAQVKTLLADPSLEREQRRPAMRKIMNETQEKISALLTPEQKTKHEEMRKQWGPGGHRGEGHHGEAGGPPPPPPPPPPPNAPGQN